MRLHYSYLGILLSDKITTESSEDTECNWILDKHILRKHSKSGCKRQNCFLVCLIRRSNYCVLVINSFMVWITYNQTYFFFWVILQQDRTVAKTELLISGLKFWEAKCFQQKNFENLKQPHFAPHCLMMSNFQVSCKHACLHRLCLWAMSSKDLILFSIWWSEELLMNCPSWHNG